MAPLIIDLKNADDPRDIVHRAVQALVEGKLVAFPLETVYVVAASSLREDAVARLSKAVGREGEAPLTLAIKSTSEAFDFAPGLHPVAARLARRCWPGPVTLEVMDGAADSAIRRLPSSVRQLVAPQGCMRLRVPQQELIADVLRLMAGPLVVAAAKAPGGEDPVTAQDVAKQLGSNVDVILDGGRCRIAQPSSVIRVDDKELRLVRPGPLGAGQLKRMASFVAVVVCTGNTCRSPMGEAILRQRLAEKIGCPLDELEANGVVVLSAGVAASAGGSAAQEAIGVMRERGLDLSQHESQPLGDRLIRFADLILTMTRNHRQAILSDFPEAADRTHLVSQDRGDVADPIGGTTEQYRRCADQIDSHLQRWASELALQRITEDPNADTAFRILES